MFQRFPRFLKLGRIVTHFRLQHSLTRCLWCVFRHQLPPDFEPASVRHSLCQTQTSSRGQWRQQGVQCVAQRSDEHGGLIGSRPQVEMLRPPEAPRTSRSQE